MPVTATRWAAVVDAVLATLRADPNFASTQVFDGPPVTGDYLADAVAVGASGDDDDLVGDVEQNYHDFGLAQSARMETSTVRVAVWAQNGDGSLSTARTRAFALVGYVEAALRANPSQGLTDVLRVEVTGAEVRQSQTPDGALCWVDLTLTATALI